MRFLAGLLLFPALAGAALGPDVRLNGRRLSAKPSSLHSPLEQTIEIVESEDCAYKAVGEAALEMSGNCRYLSGVYRYVYQPEANGPKRQVATGFAVSLPGPASHVLLVSVPMTMIESAP